jgi:hypothetical protein
VNNPISAAIPMIISFSIGSGFKVQHLNDNQNYNGEHVNTNDLGQTPWMLNELACERVNPV